MVMGSMMVAAFWVVAVAPVVCMAQYLTLYLTPQTIQDTDRRLVENAPV